MFCLTWGGHRSELVSVSVTEQWKKTNQPAGRWAELGGGTWTDLTETEQELQMGPRGGPGPRSWPGNSAGLESATPHPVQARQRGLWSVNPAAP